MTGSQPTESDGQQTTTTQAGAPPVIIDGQTNRASHNLDLYNPRFPELDQIDTATVGQLEVR